MLRNRGFQTHAIVTLSADQLRLQKCLLKKRSFTKKWSYHDNYMEDVEVVIQLSVVSKNGGIMVT